MPFIQYRDFNFSDARRSLIDQANEIIAAYRRQGYTLKATSHPRDWYSLAMFLDGGLQLAARGEAFQERSAT